MQYRLNELCKEKADRIFDDFGDHINEFHKMSNEGIIEFDAKSKEILNSMIEVYDEAARNVGSEESKMLGKTHLKDKVFLMFHEAYRRQISLWEKNIDDKIYHKVLKIKKKIDMLDIDVFNEI